MNNSKILGLPRAGEKQSRFNAYTSFEGHVVSRVDPGGERYKVFVLDDRQEGLLVKSVHAPYISN